jgi:hypothetical protein
MRGKTKKETNILDHIPDLDLGLDLDHMLDPGLDPDLDPDLPSSESLDISRDLVWRG